MVWNFLFYSENLCVFLFSGGIEVGFSIGSFFFEFLKFFKEKNVQNHNLPKIFSGKFGKSATYQLADLQETFKSGNLPICPERFLKNNFLTWKLLINKFQRIHKLQKKFTKNRVGVSRRPSPEISGILFIFSNCLIPKKYEQKSLNKHACHFW